MNKLQLITKNPIYLKYRTFILPTAAILVSLIIVVVVMIPQLLLTLGVYKDIDAVKNKNLILDEKIKALQQLNTEEEKKNINIALSALPQDPNVPGAISQILLLLNNNRLTLDGVSFSVPQTTSSKSLTAQSYNIKVDLSGSIDGFKNFISQTKDAQRIIRINALETISGQDPSKIQATVTVSTYYASLPTTIDDIEKPIQVLSQKEKDLLIKISSSPQSTSINLPNISGPKGKADPFQ